MRCHCCGVRAVSATFKIEPFLRYGHVGSLVRLELAAEHTQCQLGHLAYFFFKAHALQQGCDTHLDIRITNSIHFAYFFCKNKQNA